VANVNPANVAVLDGVVIFLEALNGDFSFSDQAIQVAVVKVGNLVNKNVTSENITLKNLLGAADVVEAHFGVARCAFVEYSTPLVIPALPGVQLRQ
jgi:hypothetical protein